MAIRLVTFDALHTIITPRRPIHVQYSEVFAPFLGFLDPNSIKSSFKVGPSFFLKAGHTALAVVLTSDGSLALKEVQVERPAYIQGADAWWAEVIRRTALGAGADEQILDSSLHKIVPKLLERFSSREGYKAFADAIPTIQYLHDELGVSTAIVSNGDARLRSVIQDLGFPPYLSPIILSEEEGAEKPSQRIFERVLAPVNHGGKPITLADCLHVGDELVCDYQGAVAAGMQGLLLRRTGPDGGQAHKEPGESLDGVEVIKDLEAVVSFVEARNSA